ncbi:substrate-binding periplasmic protein [Thalassotalea euphylliae]|uniref:substrate-binding periplasmic protein n=1 Tax=Thalassotalea euphylliae TaxID=1655234 RepID=UPI00363B6F4E
MKSKSVLFVLLYLCSLITAQASDIRIVTEHLPPYQFVNEGNVTGLSVDIIKALQKITKESTEIEAFPWARAYQLAKTQPNILIMTLSRSVKREQEFHWIGQVASISMHVWRLKHRKDVAPKKLDDLQNYIIGAQLGDHHQESLNKIFNGKGKMSLTSSKAQEIKMLYRERVDLIFGNPKTLLPRVEKEGFDPDMIEPVLEVSEISAPLYLAFSKHTNQGKIEEYIEAFEKLEQEGTLDALRKKWLNNN